jgi:tRNA threonylcarbamoyladenosine biosynthesis protein TsaE
MSYQFVSKHEADTEVLAQHLLKRAQPGTVIAIDGDLGAGKTRFSQAAAKVLGVEGVVNSPTFTIIKEYEGQSLPLYHMDVYRIGMAEADELGLDEYFYGDGVCIVEWASLIEPLLPNERLVIWIDYVSETERVFRLLPIGAPYEQWCQELYYEGVLLR